MRSLLEVCHLYSNGRKNNILLNDCLGMVMNFNLTSILESIKSNNIIEDQSTSESILSNPASIFRLT